MKVLVHCNVQFTSEIHLLLIYIKCVGRRAKLMTKLKKTYK